MERLDGNAFFSRAFEVFEEEFFSLFHVFGEGALRHGRKSAEHRTYAVLKNRRRRDLHDLLLDQN